MYNLYINGIDFTSDVVNLDEFTISVGFNEGNTITKGLSEPCIS